jgi:hypothetical protein
MNRRLIAAALTASFTLSAMGLSTQPAAAAAPLPVYHPAPLGAAWPVWALMGGVVSLMLRAAYVQNTECRELTLDEAISGMAPIWPVYHQANNRCGAPARRHR